LLERTEVECEKGLFTVSRSPLCVLNAFVII